MNRGGALLLAAMAAGITFTHLGAQTPALPAQAPAAAPAQATFEFDFLLKGGHVVDPRNKISAVRDVAVKDGKIAAVAADIAPSRALKTVDASGLYVTPG